MELYARVRRAVFVEGVSEREAAQRFGLARETVRKMLRYAAPPGYRRQKPIRRPKLAAYTPIIDHILVSRSIYDRWSMASVVPDQSNDLASDHRPFMVTLTLR